MRLLRVSIITGFFLSTIALFSAKCFAQSQEYRFLSSWTLHGQVKVKDEGNYTQEQLQSPYADPENFHILGTQGDPDVSYDGNDQLRMCFTAFSSVTSVLGTVCTTSQDGVVWEDTKDKEKEVIHGLVPRTGERGVETVSFEKITDNFYMVWFAGFFDDYLSYIGLATSIDGKDWQNHGPVMIWENEWELPVLKQHPVKKTWHWVGGVYEPTVIVDPDAPQDERFKMFYEGASEVLDPKTNKKRWAPRIGFATSGDGVQWKRRKNAVLVADKNDPFQEKGQPNAVMDPYGRGYYLFYTESQPALNENKFRGISQAFCDNNLNCVENPNNPIIKNPGGTAVAANPSALIVDDEIILWYAILPTGQFVDVHFHVATAPLVPLKN